MLCFLLGQTYKCDSIGARGNVDREQTEGFRELSQAFLADLVWFKVFASSFSIAVIHDFAKLQAQHCPRLRLILTTG